MPSIDQRQEYDGATRRIERLGLSSLSNEIEDILTSFDLRVDERRHANGGAAVRTLIDRQFSQAKGWNQKVSGDVDWIKCVTINGARVCVGIEIQVSARSDLLIIDVDHLRKALVMGTIDVGYIVVPADSLAPFLTDRVAYFSAAAAAIIRAKAEDLPLIVLGLKHDGAGPALKKQVTRTGTGALKGAPRKKRKR